MEENDELVAVSLLNSGKWCQSLIMLDGRSKACLLLLFTDRRQAIHGAPSMPVLQAHRGL